MSSQVKTREDFKFTAFDVETVDKQFQEVVETITPDLGHEEIMKKFHKILHNRVMPAVVYGADSPAMTVYRVTPIYDEFDPLKKSCYSYPPNPSQGRANIEGSPVFYGALDPMTAILEMKGTIAEAEKFYISKWKLDFKSDIVVHSLLMNSQTIQQDHVLNGLSGKHHEQLKQMVGHPTIPEKIQDGYIHAIEKMGDLFTTKGDSLYHITSAYSHEIMYTVRGKGVSIPIIAFPSVENKQNSVNWAIHPTIADSEHMKLMEVYEMSIKENLMEEDEPTLRMSIHRRGIFEEEEFQRWEGTRFTVLDIDFSEMQLYTYNETLLRGEEVKDLEINKSGTTVEKWLNKMMNTDDFYDYLSQLPVENDSEEGILSSAVHTYEHQIILQLDHGNQVQTENGMSCIHRLLIPFKWTKRFTPID